ncbi:hypothetical protein PUN28_005425 [Cardiocondyla obscurior]|uniref:Uncharacterized protein n=1 Tax=Cardiocondyla obscurior TaxID=286306 RepID=A0AAW2GL40_9HYME
MESIRQFRISGRIRKDSIDIRASRGMLDDYDGGTRASRAERRSEHVSRSHADEESLPLAQETTIDPLIKKKNKKKKKKEDAAARFSSARRVDRVSTRQARREKLNRSRKKKKRIHGTNRARRENRRDARDKTLNDGLPRWRPGKRDKKSEKGERPSGRTLLTLQVRTRLRHGACQFLPTCGLECGSVNVAIHFRFRFPSRCVLLFHGLRRNLRACSVYESFAASQHHLRYIIKGRVSRGDLHVRNILETDTELSVFPSTPPLRPRARSNPRAYARPLSPQPRGVHLPSCSPAGVRADHPGSPRILSSPRADFSL